MVVGLAAVPLALLDGWPGPAAACAAVVVSALLDALDGAVAVQAGRISRVGFLLDSALDRLTDAAFPAALAVTAGGSTATRLAVAAAAAAWWLEYVRARASLAAGTGGTAGTAGTAGGGRQLVTPGERPTRIILTALGLAIPPLALPALWAHVVIVGASALLLLAHSALGLREPPPGPTGSA
jgi:CDP-diacylglycerol--glycerol-3-phosphate 3-phosphatidyltransferase